MKERKKIYKEMLSEARALGINIVFSYVELKKDPLIIAKAKNKLGLLIIEYVENQPNPYGGFLTASLSKRHELPDAVETETEPFYLSFGFHPTATDLFSTFLADCDELSKLFSLS